MGTAAVPADDEAVPQVVVTDSLNQPEGSAESGYRPPLLMSSATASSMTRTMVRGFPSFLNGFPSIGRKANHLAPQVGALFQRAASPPCSATPSTGVHDCAMGSAQGIPEVDTRFR